jgi:rod shape determining protein RodA
MSIKHYIEQFDFFLLAIILAITCASLVTIFSINGDEPAPNDFHKQMIWVFTSFILLAGLQFIDYRTVIRKIAPLLYGCVILLLVYLIVRGQFAVGVRRWIMIPFINLRIQPSEFAKVFTVLMLARYMEQWSGKRPRIAQMCIPFLIVGLPLLLIAKQPDLGTAMVLPPVFLVMIFAAGFRVRTLIIIGLCVLITGFFVGKNVLKPYQIRRVTVFMNPEADPLGAGYQVIQSKIAIGSGGMTGKGFQQGSQSHLKFLPVRNTDFVFAVWAEERGFAGALFLLVLYGLLVVKILKTARKSDNYFAAYSCVGILGIFFSQIVINIAMVTGMMPVTGLPLPLMSYGGSACFAYFLSLGLVLNIGMRRFPNY